MAENFIFFDVANTLLHKPKVYEEIYICISSINSAVELKKIKHNHKLLSECIKFPDKTNEEFYNYFNAELLLSLGIEPNPQLLSTIFNACSYLEWSAFEDCAAIKDINADMGIISNWDKSLPEKLKKHFGLTFIPVICSQEAGFSKPDTRIFEKALAMLEKKYDKVLYVGDSIKLDIIPAKNSGINAILIDRENIYPHFSGYKISDLTQLTKYL